MTYVQLMSNSLYFTHNVHSNAQACQTTLSTSLMPRMFIKRRFSISIHPTCISILDKMTDLQLGKLGGEWQNNLCAIIGLKPPLPLLNALLVKVQFSCLKGIIGLSPICLFKRHYWFKSTLPV